MLIKELLAEPIGGEIGVIATEGLESPAGTLGGTDVTFFQQGRKEIEELLRLRRRAG